MGNKSNDTFITTGEDPDWNGTNIVYARGASIYTKSSDGLGGETELAYHGTTGETHNPTVAINGWIVYEYDGLLYAIDSNNCAAPCTPIAALVTGHPSSVHKFPAFSPDGNQLAVSISDDLFTMNFSAGSVSSVTALTDANALNAIDTHPAWSPSGNSLMFESDRDGDRSLYTYDLTTATANAVELVSNDVFTFFAPLMVENSAIPFIGSGIAGTMALQPYGECLLQPGYFVEDFVNVRSEPSTVSSTVQVEAYLQSLNVVGRHTNSDAASPWLFVYGDTGIAVNGAWVSRSVIVEGWPCAEETLPLVDANGTPATPTPAPPTPTPTITPTSTPFVTPTLYPTSTPGTPVAPSQTLCSDRNEQWIQNLCLQGWNYLDDSQRASLEQDLSASLVTTDLISLDEWWLRRVGYGIMDVPPKIWQYDSLQQCANYVNRSGCEQIVRDTIDLFNNMGRIGVDWEDNGSGQVPAESYWEISTQELWFLGEGPPSFTSDFWGWVQRTPDLTDDERLSNFACQTNRFTSEFAGVCWVCQDVPTILYERIGYSFEQEMESESIHWNEANFRNVPAVVYSANSDARNQGGNMVLNGNNAAYRIGENVFTSTTAISGLPNLADPNSYQIFNHVGIVARGAEQGMTIEDALDYVLIAQISYSSQGYFLSVADDETNGSLNISPDGYTGRYEVITLRTYLYKHLGGLTNPIIIVDPVAQAGSYLRHWSPSALSLNYQD